MSPRSPRLAILFVLAVLASGCGGPYVLEAKVVPSDFSTMAWVDADDARLMQPGLSNVQVSIERDPGKPNASMAARQLTDADGSLYMPIGALGAGFLIEQWRIEAVRGGYQTAEQLMSLPPAKDDKRLLILMAPGYSQPTREREDLMDQYRQYR